MTALTRLRTDAQLHFALIMVSYTATAGITTVYSMLKILYGTFNEPLKIGWVVTAYWLVASISAATCGRLGDVIGRRRMCVYMLAIAGIGSLISAGATTVAVVILGCALQGATGALTPLSLGIAREVLPVAKVPQAVGIITAAGNVGAGVSFMVAGYIIDRFSWQGGFYMKVVLVVITIALLLIFVPPSKESASGLPRRGILPGLLFVPAIAGIFIALQLSQQWHWGDQRVWGVLAGSLLLLIFWGWHQSHQSTPLIDIRSLGRKEIIFANLSVGLLAVGCMQNGQVMSLFLQQPGWTGAGFGQSAFHAGIILLVLNSFSMFASPWSGRLTGRVGPRLPGMIGSGMVIAGWAAIALYHQSFLFVIAANIVALVGLAILQPAAYSAVVHATPPERTSEATGLTYVFLNTSIAIGAQIVFLLLATSSVVNPEQVQSLFPADGAYTLVFYYIVLVGLLGLAVAHFLPGREFRVAAEQ